MNDYNEVKWNKEPNSRAEVYLYPTQGKIRKIRTREKGYKEVDCFGTTLLGEIVKQATPFLPEDLSFYVPQIISTLQENSSTNLKTPFEINQFFCPGTPLNRSDSFENTQYTVNNEEVSPIDRVNYLAGGIIELMQREKFAHGDSGARHFILLPSSNQLRYLDRTGKEQTLELKQGLGIIDLEDSSLNDEHQLKIDRTNFYADLQKYIGCNEYATLGKKVVEESLKGINLIESSLILAKKRYEELYGLEIPKKFRNYLN